MPANAAVIAVLILERPMCLDCIASKSGVTVTEVDRYLTVIARSLELRRFEHERCRACGEERPVFSLHGSLN
jgi:hypothetical protein